MHLHPKKPSLGAPRSPLLGAMVATGLGFVLAIGMAAFMAGVIRAPVTWAMLMAELTGLYGLLAHFLVAALVGTAPKK